MTQYIGIDIHKKTSQVAVLDEAGKIRQWFLRAEQWCGISKAIIAVARRLVGILYALWRDNTTFELRAPRPIPPPEPKPRVRHYQLKKASPQAA